MAAEMAAEKIILMSILEDLLDSSSSDSEDEIATLLRLNKEKRPKIENYIENVVYNYTEKQFKETFRLERKTCQKLIEDFGNSKFYPGSAGPHRGTKTSTSENHILSFLWFAGNKCSLRDVSERFNIGISTLFNQIDRVNDFLVDVSSLYIKFPKTIEEKDHFAREFQKISDFPGIIGCVDGTSIKIRTPAHKIKSTYVNRHDIPSMTLQGICDYKKKFIDIFTGAPGKIHDARVFKLSFISKELPVICGKNYHILGDNAYYLREYLLTPYKDYGMLTNVQRNYNYKFSASRVLIENAFGLLKNRFRQLSELDFHNVDKITRFIVACCVLHNICIDCNDVLENVVLDVDDNNLNSAQDNEQQLRRQGEIKRDFVCLQINQ